MVKFVLSTFVNIYIDVLEIYYRSVTLKELYYQSKLTKSFFCINGASELVKIPRTPIRFSRQRNVNFHLIYK